MEVLLKLKAEQAELASKINRLKVFLHDEDIDYVTPIQQSLLIVQAQAMDTYKTCLDERILDLQVTEILKDK